MSQPFNKKFPVTGAVAQNVLSLLVANGYQGTAFADELTIDPLATTAYLGHDNTVSASGGAPMNAKPYTWRASSPSKPVDLSRMWIFIAATGDVSFIVR